MLRDEEIIADARRDASAVVAANPELAGEPALLAALADWLDPEREAYLDRG